MACLFPKSKFWTKGGINSLGYLPALMEGWSGGRAKGDPCKMALLSFTVTLGVGPHSFLVSISSHFPLFPYSIFKNTLTPVFCDYWQHFQNKAYVSAHTHTHTQINLYPVAILSSIYENVQHFPEDSGKGKLFTCHVLSQVISISPL